MLIEPSQQRTCGVGTGFDAVHALHAVDHLEASGRFPEAESVDLLQKLLLFVAPTLAFDPIEQRGNLRIELHFFVFDSARCEDQAGERRSARLGIRCRRQHRRLLGRVGIDELDLDRCAVALHEQKLIALRKAMLDDGHRDRREHVLLDRAPQRTGAHVGREAAVEQEFDRRFLPLHRPVATAKAAPLQHVAQFLLEDVAHHRTRQRPEHHDAIEPVDELRSERAADGARDLRLAVRAVAVGEPQARAAMIGRADVRSENDDAVAKVGEITLGIRQSPVVEHLQEQIPHARMRLLEFIEQHHRERLLADAIDQRVGLRLFAAVAQDAHQRMRLLELAHVEADHPIGRAEQEFGERLGHFGLAGAGGAGEQEHADRPMRIGESGLEHGDAIDQALHRDWLTHHARGEVFAQARRLQSFAIVDDAAGQPGELGQ